MVTIGGMILGRAYHPSLGMCFVEHAPESTRSLRLRSMRTGESRYVSRNLVQWRR